MKQQSKLTEKQEITLQQQIQGKGVREFANADELLRHDALHTPVPPSIALQLRESLSALPAHRPWWRRLFGG